MTEDKRKITVDEINIFLRIPKDAVALTVIATMMEDEEPVKVEKKLSVQDIFRARRDFLDYVEDGDDYDAEYVLTEEGRAELQRILEGWE